jgi:tubulin polyglutamylase TTLL6/13
MLYGVNPLRIYLYKEGIARFSTETYISPTGSNLSNVYMHLTNYAIQKTSNKYIFNSNSKKDNVGHKRSLTSVYEFLENKGADIETLQAEIRDLIIKTLISV